MISLAILAASAAVSLAPVEAAAPGAGKEEVVFQIMRNGAPIGFHRVTVEESAGETVVETRIRMKVKFGPVPLYRYMHDAREVWQGGALVSLESVTNDNGDDMSMKAWREDGALVIEGQAFAGLAPQGAAPSSYWSPPRSGLETLINTQNGELIPVETVSLGRTQAPDGRLAEHVRMTGTVELNLWYDGDEWVGSSFVIDGEKLDYVPASPEETRARTVAGM